MIFRVGTTVGNFHVDLPRSLRPFLSLVRMGRWAVSATLLEGRAPNAIARAAVGRLRRAGLHRVEWSSAALGEAVAFPDH
jgi:hypothetical protein